MPCRLPKDERPVAVQRLILDYFRALAPDKKVDLDTSLGPPSPPGLGHLPAKRKLYYLDIQDVLSKFGCKMKTLRAQDFGDTKRHETVGEIAAMVLKDLAIASAGELRVAQVRMANRASLGFTVFRAAAPAKVKTARRAHASAAGTFARQPSSPPGPLQTVAQARRRAKRHG